MGETVGELLVKIGADTSDLKRGTGEARRDLRSLATDAAAPIPGFTRLAGSVSAVQAGLATIGAGAALGAIVNLGREAIATAGALSDQASRIGLNVEALQELQFAAGQAGVSGEALGRSLEIFVRNVGQARAGTGQLVSALQDVNPELLNTVRNADSAEQALDAAFAAIGNAADGFERAQLAAALFGRAGQELLPMLDRGADGLEEMRRRARELGVVLGKELVDGGDAAGDAIDELLNVIRKNLSRDMLEASAAIEDTAESATGLVASFFAASRAARALRVETNFRRASELEIVVNFGSVDAARARLAQLQDEIETMRGLNLKGLLDESGRDELTRIRQEAQRLADMLAQALPKAAAVASDALSGLFAEERQAEAAEYGDTVAAALAQIREAKNESGAIKLELQGPSPDEWRQALPADEVAKFDDAIEKLKLEALATRIGGIEGASAAATQRIIANLTAQGASIQQATQAAEQYVAQLQDTESARIFGEMRDDIERARLEIEKLKFVGPTAELQAANAEIDFMVENYGLAEEEAAKLKELNEGLFDEKQLALTERAFNQVGEDLRIANANAELLGNTLEGDLKRAQSEAASYGRAIQDLIARGYEVSSKEVQELVSKQREAEASAQSYAAAIAAGADEARRTAEELARVNEGLNDLRGGRTGNVTELQSGNLEGNRAALEELAAAGDAAGIQGLIEDLTELRAALGENVGNRLFGGFFAQEAEGLRSLITEAQFLLGHLGGAGSSAATTARNEQRAAPSSAPSAGVAGGGFAGRMTVELSENDRAILRESNGTLGTIAGNTGATVAEISGDRFAGRLEDRINRSVRSRTGNRNFAIGG